MSEFEFQSKSKSPLQYPIGHVYVIISLKITEVHIFQNKLCLFCKPGNSTENSLLCVVIVCRCSCSLHQVPNRITMPMPLWVGPHKQFGELILQVSYWQESIAVTSYFSQCIHPCSDGNHRCRAFESLFVCYPF